MKKILIIITKSEMGGAQMITVSLARQLKQRGYDLRIGTSAETPGFLNDAARAAHIPVIHFNYLRRTFNPLTNMLFSHELGSYLARRPADIVHFHSSNALVGARAAQRSPGKPKTMFTFHGLSFLDPHHGARLTKTALTIAYTYFLRFIDEPIFVCQKNYDDAMRADLVQKGHVIYNGTENISFVSKESARAFLADRSGLYLSDAYIAGSIGRLAYPKNYEFLIQRARHCPQKTVFIIIGEGPERQQYEKLIQQVSLENRVAFVGEIPDAARYTAAFDIFVLPSVYEGLPLTLVDALKAGIPVLASRVGGIPEIVPENNIQTYLLNNETSFHEHLTKIMNNPSLTKHLGEINRARGAQFSVSAMTDGYEKLINPVRDK